MAIPVSIKGGCCCRQVEIGDTPLKWDLWWLTAGQGWMILVQFVECGLCVAMGMINPFICHGEWVVHSLLWGCSMDKFVHKDRNCKTPCVVCTLFILNLWYVVLSLCGVVLLLATADPELRFSSPLQWHAGRRLQQSRPVWAVLSAETEKRRCDECMSVKSCCSVWDKCSSASIDMAALSAGESWEYEHLMTYESKCVESAEYCWSSSHDDYFGKLGSSWLAEMHGPCSRVQQMNKYFAMRFWMAFVVSVWCGFHVRITWACWKVMRQVEHVNLFATDGEVKSFVPPPVALGASSSKPSDQVKALEKELQLCRAELGKCKTELTQVKTELGTCKSQLTEFTYEKGLQRATPEVFEAVQALLDSTFKAVKTRDRKDGKGLPSRLRCTRVFVFETPAPLAKQYDQRKEAIGKKKATPLDTYGGGCAKTAESSGAVLGKTKLNPAVNEVLLWHGSKRPAALSISREGFNLELSGSKTGSLYGKGIYFAECSSKADEYADPKEPCLLLCRVVMGEILKLTVGGDAVKTVVEAGIKSGAYHSVMGDRESHVGTFREFVVFDKAQARPEFLVEYVREYA